MREQNNDKHSASTWYHTDKVIRWRFLPFFARTRHTHCAREGRNDLLPNEATKSGLGCGCGSICIFTFHYPEELLLGDPTVVV